ncbi:MAG TPA: tetratricopeptide repeat protein [Methylibium sp.]|nr:tetratricopeptide repeat protein [Methylibium sp.]
MSKSSRSARRNAAPVTMLERPSPQTALHRLLEAQRLLAVGRHAPADALLQPLLDVPPLRGEVHHLLAIAALMGERPAAALQHASAAVGERPGDPRFQFALGRAHKARGELGEAETAYRRAVTLNPGYAEAMVSLGIVRKSLGDLDGAVEQYELALALDPRMPSAHANLANALALRAERRARTGFDDEVDAEAVDAQGRAVTLAPDNAQLHRNYGVLLLRARRHREAIAAFNQTLTLDPADVEACLRLGDSLAAIGDAALACEAYRKWMDRSGPRAPLMRALAALLTRGGEVDEALEWSEKAVALDPDASALITLGSTLMQSRRLEDALARCRQGVDLGGRQADLYPALLLGLSYLQEQPEPIFAAHREFAARLPAAPLRPAWRPRPPRLRVGYVSGDFVRHSVSYFIGGLLERHDRDRFEVFCYHANARSDAVTERLKALGHHWIECDGLSDEALRRRIVADGIDVLVDLSGHTAGSRVFVFAQGAAPLQIGYLGYPTVSGVPAIDYRITDAVIDPGDQPPLAHDRPLALPRTMFCYRPDDAPPLAPPPVLANGHVTFGSFNNIAKVTDRTLALWAAVLDALPGSRLLLKSTSMAQATNRASIERFMAERGIAADRLRLQPWQADKHGHLGMYNDVDIALDSYPYNGATTTCEALWMGVPVVSRRGATHTSRMGASLLGAIGRAAWVAESDADFVAIAARLAADPQGLAQARAASRERLRASELLDEAGFVAAFEAALDRAWALRGAQTGPA